jgi:hypothetical protein
MRDWPVRCTSSKDMKVQPFVSCVAVLACTTATIAGQQSSSQSDTPRSTSSTTTSSSPSPQTLPSSSPPSQPLPSPPPPPPQLPEIGRPAVEATAPARPDAQTPCASDRAILVDPAIAPAAQAASSTSFPGVSASQLPRAGVSAEKFVRPGVSAAELATLQPGSRSARCAPRDVILYPENGTPSRRVPPPGENEP